MRVALWAKLRHKLRAGGQGTSPAKSKAPVKRNLPQLHFSRCCMRRLFFVDRRFGFRAGRPRAEEFPVRPYADPAQLDVPWPKHSYYKQPWRGFLETRSGYDFLRGIGVNYNVPGNDPLAVRLLAEAGFKTFRIEIGFGSVLWDQTGLSNQERHGEAARAVQAVRHPADDAAERPSRCALPAEVLHPRLAADAPRGSRDVQLTDTRDLVVGRSGINGLTNTGRPRPSSRRSTRRPADVN